eukprot:Transcript_27924.p1 GENE.Transcript_27924~~Transcript_27924.p1  ORF type:complete len:179 (-),score=42.37 Transcript_27924:68-604(-)
MSVWPRLALLAVVPLAAANDLLKAIEGNNPSQLNMALKSTHPKKLNEVGETGMTPLMTAVTKGKHKVIKGLLKGGADPSVANADGYTVMHVAAEEGHERVLQVLITHGLDANERHEDGLTPLHRAVAKGHTDTVKSLLNAEVPVDQLTGDGRTPMDLAPDLATKEVLGKFSRSTKSEL